ncbi:MAG: ferritin-like domain-containing protein [Proteobacteria bacterium]|nr:ferritin-like domain-containing protein [Pseudomonadota bacterium]
MASIPTRREAAERYANLPQVRRWRDGNYEPGAWFNSDPESPESPWGNWGREFKPTRRGITTVDLNRAFDDVPDQGAGLVVDRGGGADAGATRWEYPLNQRYEVWAYNLESLLEEAISRQWSATSDLPWDKLEPLPDDQERAMCQFLSFLHPVEFTPTDILPHYMMRVDPSFPEVRQFMATQCADESRHMEAFGKRMFANGGGPGIEPTAEALLSMSADTLSSALKPEDHPDVIGPTNPRATWEFLGMSYSVQMMGEAVVLDFFRFGEFLGRNPCDKEMFRRVLQDEARHVSFGTMRIKYYLDHAPAEERERALEMLHYFASVDEATASGFGLLINPNVIEPFALMAAGSTGELDKGWDMVREFWAGCVEEYLARCDRAGFPRRDKCLIPREAPF